MGVSEVLLCPYRCLEYKMERLEKLKIQLNSMLYQYVWSSEDWLSRIKLVMNVDGEL